MGPLREMFRYHLWATLRVLDHCLSLRPEQLAASLPGTYGPPPSVFVHLVGTEWWILGQLGEPPPPPRLERSEALPALRQHVVEQAKAWQNVLTRLPDTKLTLPAVEGQHPEIANAGTLLVIQALHHGELHRTEIRSVLGAIGASMPGRDSTNPWAYWMEVRP
jgi:uncharacterized damage-inducible protein DinB